MCLFECFIIPKKSRSLFIVAVVILASQPELVKDVSFTNINPSYSKSFKMTLI